MKETDSYIRSSLTLLGIFFASLYVDSMYFIMARRCLESLKYRLTYIKKKLHLGSLDGAAGHLVTLKLF